jgi:drug/metabolite transporter (DMT)-like permease
MNIAGQKNLACDLEESPLLGDDGPQKSPNVTSFLHTVTLVALFSVVCLVWATTWIGIKLTIDGIAPMTAAGMRFVLCFPILWGIVRFMKQPLLFPKGHWKFFSFITIFYFTLPYFLMNFGEKFIAPGLAALIFSAMPIFSMIFSSWILKTSISWLQSVGILMGFSGFAMIFYRESSVADVGSSIGMIALFAAAVMHGFCYVFTKRYGGDVSVATYNALPIGIAGLLMTVMGLLTEHTAWHEVSTVSWAALIYLVFAAIAGFLSYFYLLKIMSPVIASFVYLIFPVISILIDVTISGKGIDLPFIFLTTLILIGFAVTKVSAASGK